MQDTTAQFSMAGGIGLVIAITFLFLALLPVIVAVSKSRLTLQIASVVLSVLALVAGAASFSNGFSGAIFLPFAGASWLAGLLCGLVAFSDAATERREREIAFRVIHGDARNLPIPSSLRHADRM